MTALTDCSWEYGLGGYYYIVMASVYVIGILILFIAIAIVCDDYFVPSLEVICKRLNLSEDVAGATFMAAGSSAPELFTSLAAVSNDSDIGVGTIVGSAVFNILIIISLSAILSKNVLILDWRPLSRDAFFYGVSIVMFSAFAWDGMFTWWESVATLVYYFLYIVTLKFNPLLFRLLDAINSRCCGCCIIPPTQEEDPENTKIQVLSDNSIGPIVQITPPTSDPTITFKDVSYRPLREVSVEFRPKVGLGVPVTMMRTHSSGSSGIGSMTDDIPLSNIDHEPWVDKCESLESVSVEGKPHVNGDGVTNSTHEEEEEEEEEDFDEVQVCICACCPRVMTSLPRRRARPCSPLHYLLSLLYFTVAFPFQLLFSFTIPNSMKSHLKKFYILSFIGSVVWIALLSYSMVLLVERFGCIVGFNDYVMGLVVVAAGTSVPDALSSVIVAREGHGDMAVSNALGSNVFDINLGLGLPFLIKNLYTNGPIVLVKDPSIEMLLKPHAKFGIILLFILLLVYSLLALNSFRLTRTIGLVLVVLYVMFITYSLVQELLCDAGRLC